MSTIRLGKTQIDMDSLRTKQDLLDYFHEHGATHAALMDFCEDYMNAYGNPLYWSYPISDGKHRGVFLVLVREGILSVPYDAASQNEYEIFGIEDISIFTDYADLDIFIDDWVLFHNDLMAALTGMRAFLYSQADLESSAQD